MRFPNCCYVLALLPAFAATDSGKGIELTKPSLDVTIVTNDGAKADEFYGEVLGLKKLGPTAKLADGGRITQYRTASATIRIIVPPKPAAQFTEAMDKAAGIRGLAFMLPDADQFTKNLASHGRPEPTFLPAKNGGKLARILDPDGNWLELIFPPPNVPDPSRLNYMAIILMTTDEAKSRDFYGKVLGLEEAAPHGKPETGLLYAYSSGQSQILVKGIASNAPNRAGKLTDAVGIRGITFYVNDVDAVERMFRERSVKISVPPFDHPGSIRMMFAADPDGNFLQFASAKAAAAATK